MPAAAVIPAPIAYIKVVAVKKLVVGLQAVADGAPSWRFYCLRRPTSREPFVPLTGCVRGSGPLL